MDQVLAQLARSSDPNLLVGFEHADDAGVYLIAPDLALVQTVDFFTPIVDDPFAFGQIAAANALSDVYAMGGEPRTALNIAAIPDDVPAAIVGEIARGGLSKLEEAGCTLVGGHSVRDVELKFGYAITGLVRPGETLTNAGARAGDALVLSKALGTGVIATALKRGQARDADVAAAVASMTTLNRDAARALAGLAAHAATDVTGFGLLGHAREMAAASAARLTIYAEAVPLLPGALGYAAHFRPRGLNDNRDFAACAVAFDAAIGDDLQALLFDPQTSGGMLVALPAERAPELLRRWRDLGLAAATIGRVEPPAPDQRPLAVVPGQPR